MERLILIGFVLAVVVVGLGAGGAQLLGLGNPSDDWSPRAYVPVNGDCFVPPQGDPLYDEYYAKNVNAYNCEAFVDQAYAKSIDAQTEQVRLSTQQTRLGIGSMLFVIVCVIVLLAIAIIR